MDFKMEIIGCGFVFVFQMRMDGSTAVLEIKTTYAEDTGTFTCRATNQAGQTETSVQVTIKSKQ